MPSIHLNPKDPYYDRNPTDTTIVFTSAPLAPHATTQRASYTVPAKRKALVTSATTRVTRVTAAAPVGTAQAFSENFNTSATISLVQIFSNGVGDTAFDGKSVGNVYLAGILLDLEDVDTSTGGTVAYVEILTITEFDA